MTRRRKAPLTHLTTPALADAIEVTTTGDALAPVISDTGWDVLEPDEVILGEAMQDDGAHRVVTSHGRRLTLHPDGEVSIDIGEPGPVLLAHPGFRRQ